MMMWWWIILIPIILIFPIMFYRRRGSRNSQRRENPRDILDNRLAKGEISKEEYEEQKRAMDSNK